MKRFVCCLTICFLSFAFCGCETTDTEIANALEGNMTRLVYSVGYLDSISADEINSLVNGGSTYFYNSSLYNGSGVIDNMVDDPNLASVDGTRIEGGLQGSPLTASATATNYRSRSYSSSLTPISSTSAVASTPTYSGGVVDISLLETSAADLNDILLEISQRRGIIMLYCTDLRSGRASLTSEDKVALNEYIDIIKETTNYLNNNAGNLTNHYNNISSIALEENSAEIINARLIRANETLKTRYAKLDTCLDSLAAITNILVTRIGPTYTDLYSSSLTGGVNNISNNLVDNSTLAPPETIIEETIEEEIESECETSTSGCSNNLINNDNIYNNNNLYGGNCGTFKGGCNNINYSNGCCGSSYNYNCTNNSCSEASGINNANNCCLSCYNNLTTQNGLNCDNNFMAPKSEANNNSLIGSTPSPINVEPSITYPISPANNGTNTEGSTSTNNLDRNLAGGNNLAVPNSASLPTNNTPATNITLTEEEIALSGGLVKNNALAKHLTMPASILAVSEKEDRPETPKLDKTAEKLSIVPPQNKREKEPIINLPHTVTPDLSEPEITESEKELTPDLLPFMGEESPFGGLPIKELGMLRVAPIRYQEDMPIMNIPRK